MIIGLVVTYRKGERFAHGGGWPSALRCHKQSYSDNALGAIVTAPGRIVAEPVEFEDDQIVSVRLASQFAAVNSSGLGSHWF
jgi:hypothetical protein